MADELALAQTKPVTKFGPGNHATNGRRYGKNFGANAETVSVIPILSD
jgi:hypothetical protein